MSMSCLRIHLCLILLKFGGQILSILLCLLEVWKICLLRWVLALSRRHICPVLIARSISRHLLRCVITSLRNTLSSITKPVDRVENLHWKILVVLRSEPDVVMFLSLRRKEYHQRCPPLLRSLWPRLRRTHGPIRRLRGSSSHLWLLRLRLWNLLLRLLLLRPWNLLLL